MLTISAEDISNKSRCQEYPNPRFFTCSSLVGSKNSACFSNSTPPYPFQSSHKHPLNHHLKRQVPRRSEGHPNPRHVTPFKALRGDGRDRHYLWTVTGPLHAGWRSRTQGNWEEFQSQFDSESEFRPRETAQRYRPRSRSHQSISHDTRGGPRPDPNSPDLFNSCRAETEILPARVHVPSYSAAGLVPWFWVAFLCRKNCKYFENTGIRFLVG